MSDKQQHIIRVTAEQFKNVKVVDFMPNRYVTKISGANGAGKTSALDAIFQGLLPRKTLSPALIRQGQKKGFLRIETNTHIITRKLDDGGGSLTIEQKASSALEKKPDEWLKGITGKLGFDPLSFMRLSPEEQFEVLRGLVELDVNIDDLDVRNDNDEEAIKQHRAEIRGLEATLARIPAVDPRLPPEPVNVADLLAERAALEANNRSVEERRRKYHEEDVALDSRKGTLASMQERHDRLSAELLDLSREMDNVRRGIETTAERIAKREPLPEPKDATQIDEKIRSAADSNDAIHANNMRRKQREQTDRDIDEHKTKMDALQNAVRERKLTIARTLEQAKFPIPGLSFETIEEGSGGRERKKPKKIVTYHGIPLTEASTAEQIRVSTAIGMAGKPDLRFLLIREGSLLDDNGMAILEQMAYEQGYQILMEVVDTSGKVGIFLEDGMVKAVNPEPSEGKEGKKASASKKRTKVQAENQSSLI